MSIGRIINIFIPPQGFNTKNEPVNKNLNKIVNNSTANNKPISLAGAILEATNQQKPDAEIKPRNVDVFVPHKDTV